MAERAPLTDDRGRISEADETADDKQSDRESDVYVISDSEGWSDCESDKTAHSEREEDAEEDEKKSLECPVCIQSCVHPARLPCGHIFCFLCVKGIAHGSKRCAMCRHPIPPDYLDNPDLVYTVEPDQTHNPTEETYQWYYEGRNGWWQYDERACQDVEAAFGAGQPNCELLIAGYLYTIDFAAMVQWRSSDPARRRRIKRDLSTCTKKGVAGLRQPPPIQLSAINDITDSMSKLSIHTTQL